MSVLLVMQVISYKTNVTNYMCNFPVCISIDLSSPINPWKWGLYPSSLPSFLSFAQPAIYSLMLNLRRFDLWAWATYTDTQQVAILLGSIPPKLGRQHEKVWVFLTFPTRTQLLHSIQPHSRLAQPPILPSTSPPPLSCPHPHQMIFTAKYVRVRLTNIKCFKVLCDICNAGWHMDCLLPPLTAIPHGTQDSNTKPPPSFPHSRFRLWSEKKEKRTRYH